MNATAYFNYTMIKNLFKPKVSLYKVYKDTLANISKVSM